MGVVNESHKRTRPTDSTPHHPFNMHARAATSLLLIVLVSAVQGFQQQPPLAKVASSTTAVHGIFDSIVKNMESGYAGGDDSPYAKIKEQDRKREELRKKKAAERKKRGYTELKDLDVNNRKMVKLKYDGPDEEPEEGKKKLFGLF